MPITQESVDSAVTRLQQAGEDITGKAVRAEIGYGSMETISPMLKNWRLRQGLVKGSLPQTPNSQGDHAIDETLARIIPSLNSAIQEVRKETQAAAQTMIEAERQNRDTAVAMAMREVADLQGDLDGTLQELAEVRDVLSTTQADLVCERERGVRMATELAAATAAAEEATQALIAALHEAKELQAAAVGDKTELVEARAWLEAARSMVEGKDSKIADLTGEVEDLQKDVAEIRDEFTIGIAEVHERLEGVLENGTKQPAVAKVDRHTALLHGEALPKVKKKKREDFFSQSDALFEEPN